MKYYGPVPLKKGVEKILDKIDRPYDMTSTFFRGTIRLLYAIAGHYPNAMPGEATLAKEMEGITVRQVQRYVRAAVAQGWLVVYPDEGLQSRNTWSRTNRYHIPLLDSLYPGINLPSNKGDTRSPMSDDGKSPMSDDTKSSKPTGTTYPYGEKHPSDGEAALHQPQAGRGFAAPRTKVDDWDVPREERKPSKRPRRERGSRSADEIAAAAGDKRLVPRQPKEPPAFRLARYFIQQWDSVIDRRPELKDVRVGDNRKAVTGYITTTFLNPTDGRSRTEAEVQALIEGFCKRVTRGEVKIKPGQSAWQAFTGLWGRGDSRTNAYDPDIYAAWRKSQGKG